MPDDLVLHMFPSSHYNEKPRWAHDWKRLPHTRVPYLPGPHVPQLKRLSGQSQTPVLVMDGRVIAGSARILEALEQSQPQPPLLPEDPAERARALEIQRRFDEEVGPAVRTMVFSILIDEPDYLCSLFTRGQPRWKQIGYRALLPLVRGLIAKGNGVDPANVARAEARTLRALDETARAVGPSGQLAGTRFSVADLTAAALLAPLAEVSHPDMAKPRPVPERMAALFARFEAHEATQWLHEQYAKHRPPSAAR